MRRVSVNASQTLPLCVIMNPHHEAFTNLLRLAEIEARNLERSRGHSAYFFGES